MKYFNLFCAILSGCAILFTLGLMIVATVKDHPFISIMIYVVIMILNIVLMIANLSKAGII